MSLPQKYRLTDAEWDELIALVGRQDRQGIENFFNAMPEERSSAIVKWLLLNLWATVAARSPEAAREIAEYLRLNP